MSIKSNFSRRDFFKSIFLFAGGLAYLRYGPAACAPMGSQPEIPYISTPAGEIINLDGSHAPWAEFLAGATRYDPAFYEGLVNPKQADILATFLIENQRTSHNGMVALRNLAIAEGRCTGASGCIDTRLYLPDTFPNVENLGTDITQLLEKDNIFYSTPVYKIGGQPTIFQQNINQSFYVAHQTAIGVRPTECIESGCGLFAGIDTILKDPIGVEILKQHHGVSDATIEEMYRLIAMGNNADPVAWAKAGARMQAEINYVAHGSQEVQYAAYGVYGHANDGFVASTEVIDNFGIIHDINEPKFSMLKAYAAYMDKPHPIIAAYAEGQAPAIVAINGSRVLGTEDIYGDLVKNKGITMPSEVDRIPGQPPVTWEEAKRVSAGAFYGTSVLENDKVLIVTADNATDLETLINFVKTEGIRTGNIQKFVDEGGIIVGMIPDKTGKIGLVTNVINSENIGAEITKLNILRKGAFEMASREHFIEIIKANKLGGKLSESQLLRLAKYYEIARPFLPFLKIGLDVLGLYFTILDEINFTNKMMGHDLIYETVPNGISSIFANDYKEFLPNEYQQIKDNLPEEWRGANPYVVSGRVKGIKVLNGDMAEEYLKGWFAWTTFREKIGIKIANNEQFTEEEMASPYFNMERQNQYGQLMILNIPVELPNDPHDHALSSIKLYTTLVIKNGINEFGEPQFIPQEINDDNANMIIEDDMTGQFTSLSPEDGPMQFVATDESGFQYLMEAIPKTETKSFELKFVAPLGQQNQISLKENLKKKFAKLKQKKFPAVGTIFDPSFQPLPTALRSG